MRLKLGLVLVLGQLMMAPGVLHAQNKDRWQVLVDAAHHTTYLVVDRNQECFSGSIVAINDHDLTVNFESEQVSHGNPYRKRSLARAHILRVEDGRGRPIDVVYSGRNSWFDVLALQKIASDESVYVLTKAGAHYKGKLLSTSSTMLSVGRQGKATQIARDRVSRVYYVREKPMTDGMIYSCQELTFLAFLDPRLIPYILHIPPKTSVPLYDAARPEDDTPYSCKRRP